MTPATDERRIIILGATGSIGRSTLEVVRHLAARGGRTYRVVGVAASRNGSELARIAREFRVEAAALADGDATLDLPSGVRSFRGVDSARELIDAVARPGDLVMAAMVGFAGVAPTLLAIERGCTIALANKETLVAAGEVVMAAARRRGVALLPVDSEHSAIAQCLPLRGTPAEEAACREDTRDPVAARGIRRIVLTASGGPFRTWPLERMARAAPEEALRHPTWSMGAKNTIDSATMMNKALEVIEAHWLFDLPADRIEALIHPQSIVHGFVEFDDGSVLAQLSPPDMRLPIQVALTWPDRAPGSTAALDFSSLRALTFEPIDPRRFPAMALAHRVVREGGTLGAILNATNEIAVAAYLRGSIHFGRISSLVAEALDSVPRRAVATIDDIIAADADARAFAAERCHAAPQEMSAWTH